MENPGLRVDLLLIVGCYMWLTWRSCEKSYPFCPLMLDALISSKTRIKLLLKFFINPQQSAYLRSLAAEFDESTNSVRLELNRLEEATLVQSYMDGNRKMYKANLSHPLFNELRTIVLKHLGLDQFIEHIVEKLGDVKKVYLIGELARGSNSDLIDVVFIGDLDKLYLLDLVEKAQKVLNRKIRFVVYGLTEALPKELLGEEALVLWET